MGTPYLQIPLVYQYNISTLLVPNPGPQAPLLSSWLSLEFVSKLNVHTQLGEGKETWAASPSGWQQQHWLWWYHNLAQGGNAGPLTHLTHTSPPSSWFSEHTYYSYPIVWRQRETLHSLQYCLQARGAYTPVLTLVANTRFHTHIQFSPVAGIDIWLESEITQNNS